MTAGQHTRRIFIPAMALCALFSLCLTTDGRRAEAVPSVGTCYGKVIKLTVSDKGGRAKLLVHSKKLTTIRMADNVIRTAMVKGAKFHVEEVGTKIVETKPFSGVTEHPPTNLQVVTNEYPVSFDLEIVQDYDRAADVVEVVAQSRVEREAHEALRRTLRQLVSHQDMIGAETSPQSSVATGRYASILQAPYMDNEQYLVFDIYNDSQRPFELDGVQLVVSRQETIELSTVYLDKPGEPERGIISIIPPRQSARGAVRVPERVKVDDIGSLSLALSELSSAMPLVATATGRFVLTDLTEEEHKLRLRDRAARGRVTLQLRPLYGAMWLANPLEDSPLGMASLSGVSIRAAYGFNRFLSVEGELSGAASGQARFDGMAYNNMQGALTRKARFGRAQIGGLLKLGHRYVPTLRLGVGLQGTDHGAEFTPEGGQSIDGPDLGFQAKAYFTFGAGFDVRLNRRWLAGLDTSFAQLLADESSVLLFGLHLGYSWQPDPRIE